MVRHVSAHEVETHFAELADRVSDTGEPIIVERDGRPLVALVSLRDLAVLDRLRRPADEFTRLAAEATRQHPSPEMTEEEVAQEMKATRAALYREWYGRE